MASVFWFLPCVLVVGRATRFVGGIFIFLVRLLWYLLSKISLFRWLLRALMTAISWILSWIVSLVQGIFSCLNSMFLFAAAVIGLLAAVLASIRSVTECKTTRPWNYDQDVKLVGVVDSDLGALAVVDPSVAKFKDDYCMAAESLIASRTDMVLPWVAFRDEIVPDWVRSPVPIDSLINPAINSTANFTVNSTTDDAAAAAAAATSSTSSDNTADAVETYLNELRSLSKGCVQKLETYWNKSRELSSVTTTIRSGVEAKRLQQQGLSYFSQEGRKYKAGLDNIEYRVKRAEASVNKLEARMQDPCMEELLETVGRHWGAGGGPEEMERSRRSWRYRT